MLRLKNALTYGNVVATLGVFLALGGSALAVTYAADNSVLSRSIKNGQVRTQDVFDGGVARADLAPGAVGGEQVQDDSLTGADVQESTLGEVPAAALGGLGRYGFSGSCDPETTAFVPCSVVNVDLQNPARVLVIGTALAHVASGDDRRGEGYCRIGTTAGPIPASANVVRVNEASEFYNNLTVMAVTDVMPAGNHSFGIDCNETALGVGIDYPQARVAAVALSAD
jgi:hypothetical protein